MRAPRPAAPQGAPMGAAGTLRRLRAALALALHFVAAVPVSGLQTAGVILRSALRRGAPPPSALVRMRFAPLSARGAALLSCMVSLTPGTTVIDVDMERRELLLHLLDASDAPALVADIRRRFEPGLLDLFGDRA
ncbi:Na+/H+ antiporter subunit E [Azohydromonas aeria]|uniref:Na+/H+ antiporter subunit E n=1 Tax=Azohydromonas aeria TaxID=2590212 RepID=UPI0012F73AD0|nr:Na+/H+ antiporter subunit E [Azohydromonas aeria]